MPVQEHSVNIYKRMNHKKNKVGKKFSNSE